MEEICDLSHFFQAWRGYHGNVYFEPIQVHPAGRSEPTLDVQLTTAASISRLTSRTNTLGKEGSLSPETTKNKDSNSMPTISLQGRHSKLSRASTTTSTKSAKSNKPPGPRQMSVLDKKNVFTKYNENIHEDMEWIKGQESTGSLCISPESDKERRRSMLSKERICKGSMAHRVYVEKKPCLPDHLAVSGDTFQEIKSSSTALTRPNQYSTSAMRESLNGPEMYNHTDNFHAPDNYKGTGAVRFPCVDTRTHVIPSSDKHSPFSKHNSNLRQSVH